LAPEQVANRIADVELPAALRAAVRDSLLGLLSEQSSLSHPSIGDLWRDICTNCDLGISTMTALVSAKLPGGHERLRRMLGERVKRITVKPFMDMATMVEERLLQCCVHVATRAGDDGAAPAREQCAPFCAVQAWPALSAQRLPPRVPADRVAQ
jgi:7,8-dihydro-6-hydroxymethylpterin dimethyltransferase